MAYSSEQKKQQAGKHRGRGRVAQIAPITSYEAKQRALLILRKHTLSDEADRVIDLLSASGVMLETHLMTLADVSVGSLKRYRHKHLVDLLPEAPRLHRLLRDHERVRAYTLGPVGQALAEMKNLTFPTGYYGNVDRITHDALCSLVYYYIEQAATPHGYEVILHNKYEATVYDKEGKPELEPDAMITLQKPGEPKKVYLVEYHNEDFGGRVAGKLHKYETLLGRKDGRGWKKAWQSEVEPTVLAVWTHKTVGDTYQREVRARSLEPGMWTLYLGKSLASLLAGECPLTWHNLNFNRPANLLTLTRDTR
jgi:hypothetical protein